MITMRNDTLGVVTIQWAKKGVGLQRQTIKIG